MIGRDISLGYEVLTTIVFWYIPPYSPLKINRHFEEIYSLRLQGRRISRAINQAWRYILDDKTLYLSVVLTSLTSGGRSFGIVRWRTKAPEDLTTLSVSHTLKSNDSQLVKNRRGCRRMLSWRNVICYPSMYLERLRNTKENLIRRISVSFEIRTKNPLNASRKRKRLFGVGATLKLILSAQDVIPDSAGSG
jgi:hypothetical protein